MELQQDDADVEFMEFDGTEGANTTASISTHTTLGSFAGHIQITVNGVKQWIVFTNDPSA